jgi:hypothetical protein
VKLTVFQVFASLRSLQSFGIAGFSIHLFGSNSVADFSRTSFAGSISLLACLISLSARETQQAYFLKTFEVQLLEYRRFFAGLAPEVARQSKAKPKVSFKNVMYRT